MKMKRTLKKLTAIIMVLTILLGIQGNGTVINTQASYNPVKLYSCDNVYSARGAEHSIIYIQIDASSAANKSALVHFSDRTGEWHDSKPATFFTKLDDNTEIWKASIAHSYGIDEFVIKYVGDGQTYWDNNNGNNYTKSNILGEANVKSVRLPYQSSEYYEILACVKNIAYNKVVKVRYTQDNWATYKDVDLIYDSPSTTVDNLEWWTVTLNLDKDKMFEYCIYYQVNGQTYWDNNFGANYDRSFYRPL